MAEEKSDFVVKDRRVFSQEEPQEKPSEELKAKQPDVQHSKPSESEKPVESEPPLPEINFATFILSLHSSALVHLGFMENPVGKGKSKNMALAKQTIDILAIIDEKTRGNLDKDEENLLKNILHDLRLAYVKEKD